MFVKPFVVPGLVLLCLSSCGVKKENLAYRDCTRKLAGNYTAKTYRNGTPGADLQIVVSPTNPYSQEYVLFCDTASDDTLRAFIDCESTFIKFPEQGELPGLVKGEGNFERSFREISFTLITRPGSGTEEDTMVFKLERH